MQTILVVEDELEILDIVKELLTEDGYNVLTATNGSEGITELQNNDVDLIISDVMMDKMDGFKMVEKIREFSNVPVIMLTALSEEYDEVKAFKLGVNDYITKPFKLSVFLLRVKATLNKTARTNELVDDLLVINLDSKTATYDGNDCKLTLKEFEILQHLLENNNRAYSREQIIDALWTYDFIGDPRNIDTHIKNIRKKVPNDKIKTVKGLGYKYEN